MSNYTDIPLTISPDATQRVAELGLEGVFERILEHTRQTVPGLRGIEVTLALPYDMGDEPRIGIDVLTESSGLPYDPTEDELARWKWETFPPEVSQHFVTLVASVKSDGR